MYNSSIDKVKNYCHLLSKIILPSHSQDVQHEVKLGVMIGKAGSHILGAKAEGYILGYCIFLDIAARDIQKEEIKGGVP